MLATRIALRRGWRPEEHRRCTCSSCSTRANEVQPIDARLLRDGLLRIGRDSAADWSIADPDCELSRAHCELAVADGALTLRALGANGVFDDRTGERFPDAVEVADAAARRRCASGGSG